MSLTGTGPTSAPGHVRGSGLLLSGRFIAIGLDLVAQVLVVRYLTKEDFGAFAYALAVVSIASSFAAFGLDKAISRFLPIYDERGERDKVLGSLLLAASTMLLIGAALIVLFYGLTAFGLTSEDPATAVLLILVLLVPIQAIQPLFTAVFAVFSSARAIFFRNHILAPGVQLLVVAFVIFGGASLSWLAVGWVVSGLVGVVVSVPLLYRILKGRGYLSSNERTGVRIPVRELYGFSVPLLSSDLVLVLRGSLVPVLLAYLATTIDVAEFRAVFPHARINLIVLQSFSLLFLPYAARLYSRQDEQGMHVLYWKSAVWVALATFPIFAITFALAPSFVEFLYGNRYAGSALIMAVLALGFFGYGALGFAGLTLRALGRVKYVFATDMGTGILSVAAYIMLIPRWGALGAATVTASTLLLQAGLYQFGLRRYAGISLFDRQYTSVYASVVAMVVGLTAMQTLFSPPLWLGLPVAAVASLVLIRLHREQLDIVHTFPELRRIPLLERFLRPPVEAATKPAPPEANKRWRP